MISTVIIDPQTQEREKVVSSLAAAENIVVLAQGEDAYDALRLVDGLKPDIAIIDHHLDIIKGTDIPPLLKIRSPRTSVVILTARISDYQLYKATSGDVSGFVYRETDLHILPEILECISEGGCFISPCLAARMLRIFTALDGEPKTAYSSAQSAFPEGEKRVEQLSKTETRILAYIGEGRTSDEIAKALGLKAGTVRNKISAVMRKTGMRNRLEMARYAISCGIVPRRPEL